MHGTQAGDKVSGDRIVVNCRKPDKGWVSIRATKKHHAFEVVARMNAKAVVEQGFKNVRS